MRSKSICPPWACVLARSCSPRPRGAASTRATGAEIGFGYRAPPGASGGADHDDPPLFLLASRAPDGAARHGDTFALPEGALRLCANDLYENKAFCVGGTAWGFQFHFEVDREAVYAFVDAFEGEVIASGFDPRDILAEAPESLGRLIDLREQVTTRFAFLVAAFQPVDDSLVQR